MMDSPDSTSGASTRPLDEAVIASPRLTIGMPLYNNAETIRRSLDSLLGQSYTGFRILISDDGSRDDGPEICDEYARRDSRIEVVCQPHNLNYGNFSYLVE